jgi:tetratricopeptide (TPR) repeat protein
MGAIQLELQMLTESRAEFKKTIEFAVSFRDVETQVRALYLLGVSYARIGNFVQASETFVQALESYATLPVKLPLLKLRILNSLGDVYKELGNVVQAEISYREGIEGVEGNQSPTILASQAWQTSVAYQSIGYFVLARHYSEQAKTLYEIEQNQSILVSLKVRQGTLLQESGQLAEALVILKDALALALEIADIYNATKATISLSCLYSSLNNIPEALEYAKKSIEFSQKTADNTLLGTAYFNLAQLYAHTNKLTEAADGYKEAIATLEKTGYTTTLSEAYFGYGKILSLSGKTTEAIAAMQKANKLRLDTRAFVK